MKIKTLIVDDEPLARSRIRNLLEAEPDVEVVGECENGLEAIEAIASLHPDLVFLDVQMPGLDGFGVVEKVGPAHMPASVFVTAFDEFAIQAFDAQALDYLLKPFAVERFQHTLARARARLSARRREALESRLEALLEEHGRGREYLERFLVRVASRITFVDAEKVDWIASEGNYLRLHIGQQSHLVRETFSSGGVPLRLRSPSSAVPACDPLRSTSAARSRGVRVGREGRI
jgi:two-component system, LytTR family, response regulator